MCTILILAYHIFLDVWSLAAESTGRTTNGETNSKKIKRNLLATVNSWFGGIPTSNHSRGVVCDIERHDWIKDPFSKESQKIRTEIHAMLLWLVLVMHGWMIETTTANEHREQYARRQYSIAIGASSLWIVEIVSVIRDHIAGSRKKSFSVFSIVARRCARLVLAWMPSTIWTVANKHTYDGISLWK